MRCLLLALVLAATAAAQDEDDLLEPGRPLPYEVVEAESGRPATDVRVSVGDSLHPSAPVFSGADGASGVLRLPEAGRVFVVVCAPGRGVQVVTFEADDPLPPRLRVELEPPLPVAGRVVDEEGRPVQVELSLRGMEPRPGVSADMDEHTLATIRTDADGRFVVREVAPGTYYNFGCGPEGATLALVIDGSADFARVWSCVHVGRGSQPLEVRLTRLVHATGQVLSAGGAPIAGATADSGDDGESVATGPDGSYALGKIAGWVLVRAPGRSAALFAVRTAQDGLALVLPPEGPPLEGRVEDPDGRGLAGVRVQVHEVDLPSTGETRFSGLDISVVTDATGAFRLTGLAAARRVAVTAADCGRVETTPGGEELRFVRPRTGKVHVAGEATEDVPIRILSGRPTEELNSHSFSFHGEPLRRDEVSVDVPEGAYVFVVEADGHEPLRREVKVRAGEFVDLGVLGLRPVVGGRAALRLRWPAAPVHTASAAWLDPATKAERTQVLELPQVRGVPCVIGPIPVGVTELRVRVRGYDALARDVTVPLRVVVGQTTTVDVDLR